MKNQSMDKYKQTYDQGETIIEQGETGEDVFLIKEGLINIVKVVDDEEITVANVGPGEILGEMSTMGQENKRSATAIADTDVTAHQFNEDQFEKIVTSNETFRKQIFQNLSKRLRQTTEEFAQTRLLEQLMARSVYLALYFVDRENRYSSDNTLEVDLDLPIESLVARFDLSEDVLKAMLENKRFEDLEFYSDDFGEDVRQATLKIVKNVVDNVEFQIPDYDVKSDEIKIGDYSNIQEAVDTAEQMVETLETLGNDLTRDQLKSIRKKHKKLKDWSEEAEYKGESTYGIDRLNAFLQSLQHRLSDIRPEDLS